MYNIFGLSIQRARGEQFDALTPTIYGSNSYKGLQELESVPIDALIVNNSG